MALMFMFEIARPFSRAATLGVCPGVRPNQGAASGLLSALINPARSVAIASSACADSTTPSSRCVASRNVK